MTYRTTDEHLNIASKLPKSVVNDEYQVCKEPGLVYHVGQRVPGQFSVLERAGSHFCGARLFLFWVGPCAFCFVKRLPEQPAHHHPNNQPEVGCIGYSEQVSTYTRPIFNWRVMQHVLARQYKLSRI